MLVIRCTQLSQFRNRDLKNLSVYYINFVKRVKFSLKVSHWMDDQNLELLGASKSTLSCWPQLHWQSLALTPVSERVDVKQADGRKYNFRIFITT
jgi:hypothetical protein